MNSWSEFRHSLPRWLFGTPIRAIVTIVVLIIACLVPSLTAWFYRNFLALPVTVAAIAGVLYIVARMLIPSHKSKKE